MNDELSTTTLVVIVTYNPEISLLKENVCALVKQFEHILIVDNESKNIDEITKLASQMNINIDTLGENKGIAFAQNVGLKVAGNKKLEWLLTMDQDSVIPENLSNEYQKVIDGNDNIGLIGWNQRSRDQKDINEIIQQDWFILSSGCLMSVKALVEAKGFDNKLFIDHVDTDVNIKIRNLGYKTLTTNKISLVHQLGTKTMHKTIKGNPYIAHSPIRIYYNVRNGVTLFKRYFFKQPQWTLIALFNCIREGIYLLLYQPHRIKNFLLLLRAWFDGIFNRLGKIKL